MMRHSLPTRGILAGTTLAVLAAVVLSWGFAEHAVERGLSMNAAREIQSSRLHHSGAPLSNLAIYGHMMVGGLLTVLAPLQLLHPIRVFAPVAHRILGYLVAILALLASVGGLFYILRNGTIGGVPMTVGFSAYGLLLAIAAIQTVRFARARDQRHRDWALRLIVLALGSWIYRIHYGVWYMLTGGLSTRPDFSGVFDIVQTVMFYLPYLLLLELWLRRKRAWVLKFE